MHRFSRSAIGFATGLILGRLIVTGDTSLWIELGLLLIGGIALIFADATRISGNP